MKKILIFACLPVIICIVLVFWYILHKSPPSPSVFDLLVDNSLIEQGCKDVVAFSIERRHSEKSLKYFIRFDLDTDDPRIFSVIIIAIDAAGFFKPSGSILFGPGGGGGSTVVRTFDGRYDIVVEQGNLGKEGVKSPTVFIDKIANELAKRHGLTSPGATEILGRP